MLPVLALYARNEPFFVLATLRVIAKQWFTHLGITSRKDRYLVPAGQPLDENRITSRK
jgi:hypothetical protein